MVKKIRERLSSKATKNNQIYTELIGDVVRLNKEANAAKREHDKVRKELYARMKDEGVDTVEVEIDGNKHTATVEIPNKMVIDMEKLKKLVTPEQWKKLITTTKGAIVDTVGTNVANQVISYEANPERENVKVK